jgi:N-acyl homoserine lactone hydrolase
MKRSSLTVSTLVLVVGSLLALASGCAATSHATAPVALGVASRGALLDAVVDQPGPLHVATITAATWEVERAGLIDLSSPTAKSAGLTEGPERVSLFVHVIRHPTRGTYLVDSGVEHAFVADPEHALVRGLLGRLAHIDKLTVTKDTKSLLTNEAPDVRGVFLTHMHLDHVLGLRDIPNAVPIFVGAGEAQASSLTNFFTRGVYDGALEGKQALQEINFRPDPDGALAGIIDVLGDASLFALSVPGHTTGSIAFLARTPTGPVLMTGDACHTAWGWKNGVGPGTFSEDIAQSATALRRLRAFAAKHPTMQVRLGHQTLEE